VSLADRGFVLVEARQAWSGALPKRLSGLRFDGCLNAKFKPRTKSGKKITAGLSVGKDGAW